MNFEQAHRLDNLHVSGTRVVFSKCAELAAQNIPVTALTLGEPDFSTPQYIVDACKRSLDAGQTRYTDGSGALHEVWFEDARSIQAKLALIPEYGMSGAGYWNGRGAGYVRGASEHAQPWRRGARA